VRSLSKQHPKKDGRYECFVAILTTGAHDLVPVSKELKNLNISFYWIRGKAEGDDNIEEYRKLLRGERRPISRLLQESSDDEGLLEF
jgi:hypothetical protein